ncbi:MAG TPA: NAD(P)-binding domain-containing protein [Candidatus Dormibacteraeota bacterium]|nr:NAD(P)-binding domain-containing protein [Candidatus Dormibacteraeota bacterium]
MGVDQPRVAVLGAGHVGRVIARLAAEAGYEVDVATTQQPEDIALTVEVMAPGARVRLLDQAVAEADLVILAIPLHRFATLDPALLEGKVVIDMMNYWPEVNGTLSQFERADAGSSELVAARLDQARVVKTLNHLGYHQLDEEAAPAGAPGRRALGIAGDDPAAVELVRGFVDRIGFDPVLIGGLAAGRRLQPDGPVFGIPMGRVDFERAMGLVPA